MFETISSSFCTIFPQQIVFMQAIPLKIHSNLSSYATILSIPVYQYPLISKVMIQCGATNGSNTAFMAELKLNSVKFQQHPRRKRNANFESGARKNRGNRQPLLLFKQ
jgi:hypothetical protein